MWNYEKRLEHPVNIKNPNPELAQVIITQFGGPNGKKTGFYCSFRGRMLYLE